jgi:hypothetical protein
MSPFVLCEGGCTHSMAKLSLLSLRGTRLFRFVLSDVNFVPVVFQSFFTLSRMPRLVGCVSVLPRSSGCRGVVLRMFDAFALFQCCCADLVDHIALVNVRCLGVVSCSSFPVHTHIGTHVDTPPSPLHTTPRPPSRSPWAQPIGPSWCSSSCRCVDPSSLHRTIHGTVECYQNGSTLQPTTYHKFTHSLTQPPACP